MTAPPVDPPHVVGIDLSLTATGIAGPGQAVLHGVKGLTTVPLMQRGEALDQLARRLFNVASAASETPAGFTAPVLYVIENLPTGRTAGGVVSTEKAYVWWQLVRLLAKAGQVIEVAPAVIKKYSTGKGNAPKQAVVEATVRRMPWYLTGGDDNLCDAAWACAIGCDLLGQPIVEVPKVHREVLGKLELPPGVRR